MRAAHDLSQGSCQQHRWPKQPAQGCHQPPSRRPDIVEQGTATSRGRQDQPLVSDILAQQREVVDLWPALGSLRAAQTTSGGARQEAGGGVVAGF